MPEKTWTINLAELELFLRSLVAGEIDYDIHKGYECGEEDGLDHYPELAEAASEILDQIIEMP